MRDADPFRITSPSWYPPCRSPKRKPLTASASFRSASSLNLRKVSLNNCLA